MYCRKCHYDLRDLGETRRCPECGSEFHPLDSHTFLEKLPEPMSFGDKFARIVTIGIIATVVALFIQFLATARGSGH